MLNESSNNVRMARVLDIVLILFIIPIIVTIFGLIFEYVVVQPAAQSWSRTYLIFNVALLISLGLNSLGMLLIWIFRKRYVREKFALFAAGETLLLVMVATVSVVSGLMPWTTNQPLSQWINGQEIVFSQVQTIDYFCLILLLSMLIGFIRGRYRNWSGLKSVEEHQREELSERPNMVVDAYSELSRVWKRQRAFAIYTALQYQPHAIMPEATAESLAWKEQSRELLTLSSTSYAFDSDDDWHDVQGCWIGLNVHSESLVLLYPVQSEEGIDRIASLISYTRRIATQRQKTFDEVIIALKEGPVPKYPVPRGLQLRIETEQTLLDRIANFADYRSDIRRRATTTTLPESTLTLPDVYVPAKGKLRHADSIEVDLETHLREWLVEPGRRHLAVLGDYGQGKSTTALVFTHQLLSDPSRLPSRVPVLIELRGKNLRNQEPTEIFGQWAGRYGISGQALLRLHEAGRLLLIFEGFDEMAQLSDYESRRSYFKAIWTFSAYPKAKILITGRPNLFESPREMEAALGLTDPFPGEAYCEPINLLPFSVAQIRQALRSQPAIVRDQICTLATQNKRFLEIVTRPSLLHVVATLWEKERLFEHVAELTSASVMGLFVRSSYTRQTRKEKVPFQFTALNSAERSYFMGGIATFMASRGLSNITNAQLNERIDRLVTAIPLSVSKEISTIGGEEDQPLRKRLEDPTTGALDQLKVEQLRTDVRSSGLLVIDAATPGSFKFGHQSFMEYLFAEVVAERFLDGTTRRARAILRATDTEVGSILKRPVSVIFLAELLSKEDNNLLSSNRKTQDSETVRARQLLTTILNAHAQLGIAKRFIAFIIALWRSAMKMIPDGVMRIFVLILGVISTLLAFMTPNEARKGIDNESNWVSIVAVFGIVFLIVSLQIIFRYYLRKFEQNLRIWNAICLRWGLSSQSLHHVIGTSWLPWTKGKPFDYFLLESDNRRGRQNIPKEVGQDAER